MGKHTPNSNGNDFSALKIKRAVVVSLIDFVIVFLLTLPTFTPPTINDIYASIKIASMVFFFSFAKELKINLHYREALKMVKNGYQTQVDNAYRRGYDEGYSRGCERCHRDQSEKKQG